MPIAEYELYKRIKLLGEGSYGKAYLVECVSDSSLCVIKQVDLSKMSEQEKKDTLKEAKILEALRHPNIVRFREVYKTKKGKLCIVMDFADGGDLTKKIKERRGAHIPEAQILDWFTQICLALKHVHDRKIIHRDLKSQNIFLTKTNIVKLGDFGIARVLTNTRDNAKTVIGTPYYLSPEIIENKPYGLKSDMWSLGVVLYELCALKPPFDGNSLHFLALKIVRGQYSPVPGHYSKDLKSLVASLLQTDPNKRPTTTQILGMPFIKARIRNFLSESVRITEFSHTILHDQKINVEDMKMEDLRDVVNEMPLPDHLVQEMKMQNLLQQKEMEKQQPIVSENNTPKSKILDQPKPTEHKQNILGRKGEEKQAPSKPNYHYRNQQQQQQPISNQVKKPTSDQKSQQQTPSNQIQVGENQGPKIVRHHAEAKPQDQKVSPENSSDNPPIANKKPDPTANLNRNKWEKKSLADHQPQPSHKLQQRADDAKKPKVVVDLKAKPQVDAKPFVEKDLVGAGSDEALSNPNSVQNRNKKDINLKDVPSKRVDSLEKNNESSKKLIVKNDKKGEPQLAKNGPIIKKDDSNSKKKSEANSQPTQADLRKGKKIEIKGENLNNQKSSNTPVKNNLSEDSAEKRLQNGHKDASKDSKSRSRTPPATTPRKGWNLVANSQAVNSKVENKQIVHSESDNNILTKAGGSNLVDDEAGLKHKDSSPDLGRRDRKKKDEAQFIFEEEEEKEETLNQDMQQDLLFVKEVQDLPPMNRNSIIKKEEEEKITYEELLQELSKIVEIPDHLKPETDDLIEVDCDNDEDREDDLDEESNKESAPETPEKNQQEESKQPNEMNNSSTLFNESIDFIADINKLEMLKSFLGEVLGKDVFSKAYEISRKLFHNGIVDLEEIEQKYSKGDNYGSVFPFMTLELRETYLPLMFTMVIMEKIQEETTSNYSDSA